MAYAECGGVIPPEVYLKVRKASYGYGMLLSLAYLRSQACISSVEEAVHTCQKIGYPIMLKASWGGGGKGIRKVSA